MGVRGLPITRHAALAPKEGPDGPKRFLGRLQVRLRAGGQGGQGGQGEAPQGPLHERAGNKGGSPAAAQGGGLPGAVRPAGRKAGKREQAQATVVGPPGGKARGPGCAGAGHGKGSADGLGPLGKAAVANCDKTAAVSTKRGPCLGLGLDRQLLRGEVNKELDLPLPKAP